MDATFLQRKIVLPNDVQEVPKLAAFVDEVCEWMGFDPMLTMQLNLAIEEAVVNVMDYAYPPGTKGEVDIEVKADADKLMFTISDNGVAFDPTAKAEVDTTLSAEERQIGGLGIHLVRHIMDNVEYERKDGRNILRLSKKRSYSLFSYPLALDVLLGKCATGTFNLLLGLNELRLQLVHRDSVERVQRSDGIGNGNDVGIILGQTVDGVNQQHDTIGSVRGSIIVERSNELLGVL